MRTTICWRVAVASSDAIERRFVAEMLAQQVPAVDFRQQRAARGTDR